MAQFEGGIRSVRRGHFGVRLSEPGELLQLEQFLSPELLVKNLVRCFLQDSKAWAEDRVSEGEEVAVLGIYDHDPYDSQSCERESETMPGKNNEGTYSKHPQLPIDNSSYTSPSAPSNDPPNQA